MLPLLLLLQANAVHGLIQHFMLLPVEVTDTS